MGDDLPPQLTALYDLLGDRPLFNKNLIEWAQENAVRFQNIKQGEEYRYGTEFAVDDGQIYYSKVKVPLVEKGHHIVVDIIDYVKYSRLNLRSIKDQSPVVLKGEKTEHRKHKCDYASSHENQDPPWEHWRNLWCSEEPLTRRWNKTTWVLEETPAGVNEAEQILVEKSRGLFLDMKNYIRQYEEHLGDVDKVVCFSLGAMNFTRPRTYVQHLAARVIADTLDEIKTKRGASAEKQNDIKIPILSQDPAYCCTGCKQLLNELNIKIAPHFSGFQAITSKTFIICISPSAPVRQIIADITSEYGGPAAMLCNPIDDDWTLPEKDPTRSWTDDESTKNLVTYKRRCHEINWGDFRHHVTTNLSEREWRLQLPLRPAEIEEGSARDEAIKNHKANVQVMLGDLRLYVRKKGEPER